jgi:hypothetical protein
VSTLIAIPVYDRPQRAPLVLASLLESVRAEPIRVAFVVSAGDEAELETCRELTAGHGDDVAVTLRVPWPAGIRGDYARKVNWALWHMRDDELWLFQAADDLRFEPGWLDVALDVARETGALVVGTNDLGNPRVIRGQASTHSLINRAYALEQGLIDTPGLALHDGYHHNFCDEELVGTARYRGVYAFAGGAIVEHMHPHWRKAAMDPVYEHGLARFRDDSRQHRDRSRRWRQRPDVERHRRRRASSPR